MRRAGPPRLVRYPAFITVSADVIRRGLWPEHAEGLDNMLMRPTKNVAHRFLLQPAMSTILASTMRAPGTRLVS
jgi:hypothetical protein